jgi:hypothetical protein
MAFIRNAEICNRYTGCGRTRQPGHVAPQSTATPAYRDARELRGAPSRSLLSDLNGRGPGGPRPERGLAHGRVVDGTGLGLSLAREIARAHGGDLEFRGVNAGVAEFRLDLPAEIATH